MSTETQKTDKDGNPIGLPDAAALAAAKQPEPPTAKLEKGATCTLFVTGPGPTLQRHRGRIVAVTPAKGAAPARADIEITPNGHKPSVWKGVPHLPEGEVQPPCFRVA